MTAIWFYSIKIKLEKKKEKKNCSPQTNRHTHRHRNWKQKKVLPLPLIVKYLKYLVVNNNEGDSGECWALKSANDGKYTFLTLELLIEKSHRDVCKSKTLPVA